MHRLFAAVLALWVVLPVSGAPAEESGTRPAIAVIAPWARATAPQAVAGGIFMTLTNTGTVDDRLVTAASPAAARVELHTHEMENGIMRMHPVEGGIAVPAGGTVELKPGGLHVMLIGLTGPLAEGGRVPLTLGFAQAGEVPVEAEVLAAGASGPPASR